MHKQTFWNRALVLSFFLHLITVPCLGIILNGYLSAPLPEKRIELELIKIASAKALNNEKLSGSSNEITQPQKTEWESPVTPPLPTENKIIENRQVKPITKDNNAVIDRTVQSSVQNPAKNSGEKSASTDNTNSQAAASGSETGSPSAVSATNGSEQARQTAEYIRPQLLSKTEPAYPERALASAREGTVSVSLEVLPNGRVGEVTIRRSSGHADLDEEAVRAVKKWRFVPAKDSLSRQAISCFVNFPVIFKLN